MVMLTDLAERPGYRELLRELIRSQILHLVGQLSQNGEECFFVSAAKGNLQPYMLGSHKGMDYMQGFTGVQTGFLQYILKEDTHLTVRCLSHYTSLERKEITYTETPTDKLSTNLDADTGLSKRSSCDNSPVNTTVGTDAHYETDVTKMPELNLKNENGSLNKCLDLKGMPQLQLAQNVKTDVEERHSVNDTSRIVKQGSKEEVQNVVPKHSVSGKTEHDSIPNSENNTDNLNQLNGTDENVTPDNSEQRNKKVTMDMLKKLKQKLCGEVKIGNGRNTEGRNSPMLNVNDSENESIEDISDLECDESEFDEMGQEEIFPQMIKGFEEIDKVKNLAKIGAGNEGLIAEKPKDKKNLKSDNAELKQGVNEKDFKMDTPNIPKVNRERFHRSTRASVESTHGSEKENHDTNIAEDDFKVQMLGSHYKFRNKLFSLGDILKPGDLLCTYCKKSCRNLKELKEHEGSHTKMYTCFKCDLVCSCNKHLRQHNSSCYEIPLFVKKYVKANPDCTAKQHLAKISPKLIIEDKPIETAIIRRRQSTGTREVAENNAASGSTLVNNLEKQLFRCNKCRQKFKFRISLKKHSCKGPQKKHSGIIKKQVKSEIRMKKQKTETEVKVSENTNLNKRINSIHNKAPIKCLNMLRNYKCPHCEKSYLSSSHLAEHIVRHTGEKNYQCSVCGLKMQYRHNFPMHKKKCEAIHPGLLCTMIRLNRKRVGEAKSSKFKMGKNDKQRIKSTFKKLKLERKDVVTAKKSAAERKLEIVRKSEGDATPAQLSFVQAAVEIAKNCMAVENSKLPRCNTCGKELANISTLKKHILALHIIGEKPFPCPNCEKRFPRASAVSVHLKFKRCKFPSNSGKRPVSKTKETKRNDSIVNKEHGIVGASIDSTKSDVNLTMASASDIDEVENVNVFDKNSKGNFPGIKKDNADASNERTEENMDMYENNIMERQENVAEDYTPPEWLTQTNTPVPYVCSVCDERFSTADEIVEHTNNDCRHTGNNIPAMTPDIQGTTYQQ